MRALATSAAQITPASDLKPAYFNEFVRYIDRGQATTRTYIINLRQFVAWMAYRGISQPTRADVTAYRDYLTTEHDAIKLDPKSPTGWTYRTDGSGSRYTVKCRPNTAAQYLRSVCAFFRWTAASGLYPDVSANIHAPKIRHDTHRKEALTAADVLKIENNIIEAARMREAAAQAAAKDPDGRAQRAQEQGARLKAMYLLAVNAGLRTVELSRANIKDLETVNGVSVLYVWGKGHTEPDAKKILAPEVRAALDDYLKIRTGKKSGNAPLFVSTGNRSGGRRMDPTTISKLLKAAMQRAGYDSERITAHSLRHTAGTNVQEITGNLYITQKYMRHENPATTEIYLHNDTERQESEIARALYNRYHGIKDSQDSRRRLDRILDTLTPEQVEQIAGIAAAIAH